MSLSLKLEHWTLKDSIATYSCRKEPDMKEPFAGSGSEVEMFFTWQHESSCQTDDWASPARTSNISRMQAAWPKRFPLVHHFSEKPHNIWRFLAGGIFFVILVFQVRTTQWEGHNARSHGSVHATSSGFTWLPARAHPVTLHWSLHSLTACFHSSYVEPDGVFHLLH